MINKIRVLIGDDSVEQGLAWAALLKQKGMFVMTRQRNGRSIFESIKSDIPDVVVVEAKMPELDAVALMAKMRDELDRSPIVIVISNFDSEEIEKEIMEAGASYYIVKPFESKILADRIEKLTTREMSNYSTGITNDIEYSVTEIIHQIGIPAHIKGYHYLRTAIILATDDPDMINSVTKVLYPTVAERYKTTSSRVERAIRHAIEIAWDRGDVDILNGFFGYTIHTSRGKPTNSEFIALIADKLSLKYRTHKTISIAS